MVAGDDTLDDERTEVSSSDAISLSNQYKYNGNKFFANKNFTEAKNCYLLGLDQLRLRTNRAANWKSDAKRLEVALRSNLALVLLKLADDVTEGGLESPSSLTENGKSEIIVEKQIEFLTQSEKECSLALMLDSSNAKIFYRRAQARELLAKCQDNNSIKVLELLSKAESDFVQCEKMLNEELRRQKWVEKSAKVTKSTIKQIVDARKSLERLERLKSLREYYGAENPASIIEKTVSLPQTSVRDSGKDNTTTRLPEASVSALETVKSPASPTSLASVSDTDNSAALVAPSLLEFADGGVQETIANRQIPSPAQQRKYITQLLSRRQPFNSIASSDSPKPHFSPAEGEAYFLINMSWWESWCRYVEFFAMYDVEQTNGHKSKPIIKSRCLSETANGSIDKSQFSEVDSWNEEMRSLLPPGATVPCYIEKYKKQMIERENKKRASCTTSEKSSVSSSSEDSDDETDLGNGRNATSCRPGTIDNSSLLLENNENVWHSPNDFIFGESYSKPSSIQKLGEDEVPSIGDTVILRNHLVRGYHFEVLPREAYAALRSWYGECTTPICRRVMNLGECPMGTSPISTNSNSKSLEIPLYFDQWASLFRQKGLHVGNFRMSGFSRCGACRSPRGRLRCTKCFSVRYCGKNCQMSHWPYHKSICKSLENLCEKERRKAGGDSEEHFDRNLVPIDSLWGRVGLNNLGNTCFMNSAVQCMSHVAPLTRYFLSQRFRADINHHNILGTGGKVADAYASVMKDLWMGGNQHRSVSPTILKRAIELFAPRFSGVSQQDSAEFLAYLLDALHEDLNKVREPPYVEIPDVDRGKKLAICGAEVWDAYCRRNNSFIFDNFYGLYKSTCVCPKCKGVSVSFETFNHITLEIPQQTSRDIVTVLVRDCDEEPNLPVKYCIAVSQYGKMLDLKAALSQASGVPTPKITLCSITNFNISNIYQDQQPLASCPNNDMVFAFETAPYNDTSKIHAVVLHRIVDDSRGDCDIYKYRQFGLPLLQSFDPNLSCSEFHSKMWARVRPFVMDAKTGRPDSGSIEDQLKSKWQIRRIDAEGNPCPVLNHRYSKNGISSNNNNSLASSSVLLPNFQATLRDLLGSECLQKIVFFSLEWSSAMDNDKVQFSKFLTMNNHESFDDYQQRVRRLNGMPAVTLDQCLESFTQPEQLDDKNMWYCSNCKEHVCAMKTVALWRLPNVLVVHLKRFEYRNSFRREKIGMLVDFPLDGLDLKRHSFFSNMLGQNVGAQNNDDIVASDTPLIYDLFGVTNHYGRMGFGHYTCYARRWNEFGVEDEWIEFDDENVTNASAGSIVSSAAYVLFYKRRVLF